MNYILGLLATLGLLIVVHEWGHYRMALACGVTVRRFSIGFGKVLWRWQPKPGGTEFTLSALPLGGYVRMLDEREGDVPADQLGGAFNRKNVWQRSAIVLAGPMANLILAVLLFAGALWVGTQEAKPVLGPPVQASLAEKAGMRAGDWVQAVSDDGHTWHNVNSMNDLFWRLSQAALNGKAVSLQVTDRDGRASRNLNLELNRLATRDIDGNLAAKVGLGAPFREPVLGEVKEGGPAAKAGLKQGDRVLSVDGEAITDAQTLHGRIRAGVRADQALSQEWRVQRGSQDLSITVLPRVEGSGAKAYGRVDAFVGKAPEQVTVHYGLLDGAWRGLTRTWETSAFTLRMLGRMLIGEASIKNLSGPITIADYAGQSVQQGASRFFEFLALVSVSLGVLNLLPLPMLDGGHLMVYIVEGVLGRPLPDEWLGRLQRGGMAVLLLMMSVAFYNDIARLLGWG